MKYWLHRGDTNIRAVKKKEASKAQYFWYFCQSDRFINHIVQIFLLCICCLIHTHTHTYPVCTLLRNMSRGELYVLSF